MNFFGDRDLDLFGYLLVIRIQNSFIKGLVNIDERIIFLVFKTRKVYDAHLMTT